MKRRLKNQSPNPGSMADIGFLLLIFFLVSTTMIKDKGIKVVLPPFYEGPPGEVIDRNVLDVKLNNTNELLIEDEFYIMGQLKAIAIDFISNPNNDLDKPKKPSNAIISLMHADNTSYETYIDAYDQLKSAVIDLRKKRAKENYGKEYHELSPSNRIAINEVYPFVISEAKFQL